MSAPRDTHPGTPSPFTVVDDAPAGAGFDPRAFLAAMAPHRGRLAAWTAGAAALALAVSFLIPATYTASVTVLEAPRPGQSNALDQLGLSAEMLGIKGGASSSALTYPDILRSRRLLEGLLVRSFAGRDGVSRRLIDVVWPGKDSPQRTEKALEALRANVDVSLDRRTNLLKVGVSDHDPVRAAAVANAACEALQDLVVHAMTTQAGANRKFVEGRLAEAERELARAEDAVRAFREQNAHPEGSPRLAMEQGRRLRELRTREEVVIALTRQYEMARVDENRDVPVLNVLDAAQPPAFRSSPRRAPMVGGGALLGLLLGLAIAWSPAGARGAAAPESVEREAA